MAFAQVNTGVIAAIVREFGLSGDFLSVGRLYPNTDVTGAYLRRLCATHGFDPTAVAGIADDERAPDEAAFFTMLGFSGSASLDVSIVERPDHLFDMNEATLPADLHSRFDLVYNNGTLEHLFHLPNALSNFTRLCRVGGCVLHSVPTNNHLDHGFYQPSPGLFFDHAAANRLEIVLSRMYRRPDKRPDTPLEPFGPDFYDPRREGERTLDGNIYSYFVMLRRLPDSLDDQIPFQGRYDPETKTGSGGGGRVEALHSQIASQRAEIDKLVSLLRQSEENASLLVENYEKRLKRLQDNNTELLRKTLGMS